MFLFPPLLAFCVFFSLVFYECLSVKYIFVCLSKLLPRLNMEIWRNQHPSLPPALLSLNLSSSSSRLWIDSIPNGTSRTAAQSSSGETEKHQQKSRTYNNKQTRTMNVWMLLTHCFPLLEILQNIWLQSGRCCVAAARRSVWGSTWRLHASGRCLEPSSSAPRWDSLLCGLGWLVELATVLWQYFLFILFTASPSIHPRTEPGLVGCKWRWTVRAGLCHGLFGGRSCAL